MWYAYFNGKKDEDCAPVEHVMNSSSGKCPLEFILVANLCHRHQSVGHRGANIGAHQHGDGNMNVHAGSDGRHNDGGEGGRTLDQDGA